MEPKFGIVMSGGFDIPFEEHAALIARAGFDSTFIGWEEKDDAAAKVRTFEKYGVEVDNFHVPHRGTNVMWNEGPEGEAFLEKLNRVVRDAGRLGVPHVIVHCTAGAPEPIPNRLGMERFRRMIAEAEKCHTKICFENLEYPEVLGAIMYELGGENIGFCWDTGHEATCTPGMHFLPLYGDRLCCVHLHDNYGASYTRVPILHGDCHMLPYDGALDFDRLARELRAVGYRGVWMIEAGKSNALGTYFDYTPEEYYARGYAALKRMAAVV